MSLIAIYRAIRGMCITVTLRRPLGTLSHRMAETSGAPIRS